MKQGGNFKVYYKSGCMPKMAPENKNALKKKKVVVFIGKRPTE